MDRAIGHIFRAISFQISQSNAKAIGVSLPALSQRIRVWVALEIITIVIIAKKDISFLIAKNAREEIAIAIFIWISYGKNQATNGAKEKNSKAETNRKVKRFLNNFSLSRSGSESICAVTTIMPKSISMPANCKNAVTVMYQPNFSCPR